MNGRRKLIAALGAAGLTATLSATGSAATASADTGTGTVTGEVLVGVDQDLYGVNAATGARRRITTTGDVGQASFSPDGTRIAYMRWLDGAKPDLWVMNADGSGQVRLTNTPVVRERAPSWSPDGTRLVFERLIGKNSNPSLAVMPAVPGAAVTVIRSSDHNDECPLGQAYVTPRWTSRNQIVANRFCFQPSGASKTRIAVYSPTGRPIKAVPASTWQLDVDPTGTKVVFLAGDARPVVKVLDLDTSRITTLTNSTQWSWLPIWSPDGVSIAWQYKDDTDTYVMNADGSNKRRLFQNWAVFVDTYDWRAVG
ncbi:MAG: hypothetical protein V9G19_25880 [Tetrasphaera sp.]